MNTQITKNKNTYTDYSLKNRILRLERILQQLLQTLTSGVPDNTMMKIKNHKESSLISDLISSSSANNSSASMPQPTFFPVKNSINNSGSSKNNIKLSRGQIIAELAIAISRASSRNS